MITHARFPLSMFILRVEWPGMSPSLAARRFPQGALRISGALRSRSGVMNGMFQGCVDAMSRDTARRYFLRYPPASISSENTSLSASPVARIGTCAS